MVNIGMRLSVAIGNVLSLFNQIYTPEMIKINDKADKRLIAGWLGFEWAYFRFFCLERKPYITDKKTPLCVTIFTQSVLG